MDKPYESATLTLGGVTRTLLLSFRAIRRIRELTGIDFLDRKTLVNWSAEHVPVILHELLAHDPEAPSVEEIDAKYLHVGNLEDAVVAIFAAANFDLRAFAEAAKEAGAGEDEGKEASELAAPLVETVGVPSPATPSPAPKRKRPRTRARPTS